MYIQFESASVGRLSEANIIGNNNLTSRRRLYLPSRLLNFYQIFIISIHTFVVNPSMTYLDVEIDLIRQSIPQGPESMSHQLVQVTLLEGRQVLLEVRPAGLGASTDGHRSAVVVVCRGTRLVDVRSLILKASRV